MVAGLKNRSDHWKSFQAKLHISAESTKGKFRKIQTILLAIPPNQFRLEAFNLWGQAVGAIVSDEKGFNLFIPSEKVVFTAEKAETLIEHFIGIPLPAETFLYSIIGSIPPDQQNTLQIQTQSSGLVGYSHNPGSNWSFSWHFTSNGSSLESIDVHQGQWGYQVSYDPAVPLDPNQTPHKIIYTSADWRMELTVDEMQVAPQMQASSFRLPLPTGIRTIDLDEAKWRARNP
jgi:outer membrane biogenesis lipoprotein LolB